MSVGASLPFFVPTLPLKIDKMVGDYNEKEVAISRNLLIFVLPNLDLNQGPSD